MSETLRVTIVLKDLSMTRIMQAADMFNTTKFIGELCDADVTCNCAREELAGQMLASLNEKKLDEQFEAEVVAVFVHGVNSAIAPGHKVVSNGRGWTTLDDIRRRLCPEEVR